VIVSPQFSGWFGEAQAVSVLVPSLESLPLGEMKYVAAETGKAQSQHTIPSTIARIIGFLQVMRKTKSLSPDQRNGVASQGIVTLTLLDGALSTPAESRLVTM
jgi:hypothetical protein